METSFEGKRALVTGGSRGIGYAIAAALLRAKATVAICGRKQRDLEEAITRLNSETNGNAFSKLADVSKCEEVGRLFEFIDTELGGIDILVNNAGVGIFRSVADLSPEDWRTTVGTNLDGVFYCCHEALPRMRRAGGGFIVNIGSLAGRNAFAGGSAYNASKFGLLGFSEALMLDHRNDKVRVTCIMPGSVDTGFGSKPVSADWKIAPEDVAEVVMQTLRMPERTLLSRIEMRPSVPAK